MVKILFERLYHIPLCLINVEGGSTSFYLGGTWKQIVKIATTLFFRTPYPIPKDDLGTNLCACDVWTWLVHWICSRRRSRSAGHRNWKPASHWLAGAPDAPWVQMRSGIQLMFVFPLRFALGKGQRPRQCVTLPLPIFPLADSAVCQLGAV